MKRKLTLFDKPEAVKRFLWSFYAVLGVLLVVDFFIPKHGAFPWEGAPDFFAVYGFISCVLLIYIAKILRLFIRRKEDYYP
jgi:hypothetical protein